MQDNHLPELSQSSHHGTPQIHSLLPPIYLSTSSSQESSPIVQTLNSLNLSSIPPHPSRAVLQRGGDIKVDLKYLHISPQQLRSISDIYTSHSHFHQLFTDLHSSQQEAAEILGNQGVDIGNLEDLSSRWSVRWSKIDGKTKQKHKRQCGSDSKARKAKDDARKAKTGGTIYPHEWKRKMPYDFTSCLAHLDITFSIESLQIIRITGIREHDPSCEKQEMQRLPPVPLHPDVWQVAIQQLNNGATIAAIQENNRQRYKAQAYDGQKVLDLEKANIRYLFLPQDSSRLYQMQARTQGVDLSQPPESNVDNWLDRSSPHYKPELAEAVFYYKARHNPSERFKLCIQTQEMKDAAWKYAHGSQLIFDGTFGICDCRLLLFIGMAIDEKGKGVPIVFLLFSAPSGSQATHAGYDTNILIELLREWVQALGEGTEGTEFRPKVAITDTDTKERGALIVVWPSIFLLLCKFHVRNAWANRRKTLIKMSTPALDFPKQQVVSRLRSLDQSLIISDQYNTAKALVQQERAYLSMMQTDPETASAAKSGLEYLDYLIKNWFSEELWRSWSQYGRNEAARILGVNVQQVAPTTNHLESFNGVLKRKHIRRFQKGGRRIRFDLFIFLLAKRILPAVFQQRAAENAFYDWLSQRFAHVGGKTLIRGSQTRRHLVNTTDVSTKSHEFSWWSDEGRLASEDEVAFIVQKKRITNFKWLDSFTLAATCASTQADMRLVTYSRYLLLMNCYGWATCSCPVFAKYGTACKHLWAMRLVVTQMQTQYSFIFPKSQEEAAKIYEMIYTPSSTQSFEGIRIPALVVDASRPLPPSNHSGNISSETDELIMSLGEVEDGSEGDDNNSQLGEEELDVFETKFLEQNQAAIMQQNQSRLAHELQQVVPRLYGIQSLLHQLGPGVVVNSQLKELGEISSSLATYLQSLPTVPQPGPGSSDQMVSSASKQDSTNQNANCTLKEKSREKRPAVIPPSPERAQKRKHSTGIF
ncbi:hypothetical protein M422DRAFT_260533 [Sphaerobolus stellatus SS14]|uniref:SWIM-type domain-containing protein n=1 Tax=Sphaerobolus stellatus (strain SS14) TaxID=990650 RepID=A0A0C9UQH0_SPHS4|nr:hypothetical protein M422DRAFT_260533 [Sphaerobolus stellatus SS14]